MALQDQAVIRLLLSGRSPYVVVTGTTAGVANTSATFSHTLVDDNGRAIVPSFVLPTNTTGANTCYVGAASTSTLIDIRSTGISQAFIAIVFA